MSLPDIIEQETNTLGASATKHEASRSAKGWRGILSMLVVLFKLRVVFLLVVAATGGAFLGAGDWPGLNLLLLTWVTGGMAAAGSSALNQYWERRSDASMSRTSQRPLVTGEISDPRWVPIVGLLLIFIPALAVISFNPALTFFLLLGAFIYVVIYTMWLKPRTLLNVVIGGLAGSAAVLCGSAAAGMWNAPGALLLAVILFFWSPFHFWSLAMIYRDEYTRADFPMLPANPAYGDRRSTACASTVFGLGLFGSSVIGNRRSILAILKTPTRSVSAKRARPFYIFQYLSAGSSACRLRGHCASFLGKKRIRERFTQSFYIF
jgi:protoheme IX farnesyltransferase